MFNMEQKSIFIEGVWRVFEIFVEEPLNLHFIKQISKKINLAPTSVKLHLKKLEEKNIVIKKKGDRFFGYVANRDNEDFLFYKKMFNMIKIKESKIIDYIKNTIYPKTIVLYGSYSRSEDIEKSDIDLLIISKTKKILELEKFEKILKRKIHIIIKKQFSALNNPMQTEIRNGIVLYGYLEDE